ncbi:hypothetical protein B0H17DRAFT_1130263 [Mycena rosella]|uniref:Uncharacterized protein n=1 Tax=Mycena rosella TaxID=1033263 RepID=A0AAD7DRX6_MYCRO|nr:hypothetical protein B0H17DRAFT_1130263 [Mycena rosella]
MLRTTQSANNLEPASQVAPRVVLDSLHLSALNAANVQAIAESSITTDIMHLRSLYLHNTPMQPLLKLNVASIKHLNICSYYIGAPINPRSEYADHLTDMSHDNMDALAGVYRLQSLHLKAPLLLSISKILRSLGNLDHLVCLRTNTFPRLMGGARQAARRSPGAGGCERVHGPWWAVRSVATRVNAHPHQAGCVADSFMITGHTRCLFSVNPPDNIPPCQGPLCEIRQSFLENEWREKHVKRGILWDGEEFAGQCIQFQFKIPSFNVKKNPWYWFICYFCAVVMITLDKIMSSKNGVAHGWIS